MSVLLGTSDEAGRWPIGRRPGGTRPGGWGRPGGQMPLWALTGLLPPARCGARCHSSGRHWGCVTGRRAGRLHTQTPQPQVRCLLRLRPHPGGETGAFALILPARELRLRAVGDSPRSPCRSGYRGPSPSSDPRAGPPTMASGTKDEVLWLFAGSEKSSHHTTQRCPYP